MAVAASHASPQASPEAPSIISTVELPDAPRPQVELATAEPFDPQATATPPSSTQAVDAKDLKDKSGEPNQPPKPQRVLGIIPSFNTTYSGNVVSLTPKQKFGLAFRSAVDPYSFGVAILVAGFGEVKGSNRGFGWGPEGYGKRVGAAYLDNFDGTMIGNAILPAILHQDPRYFRLGHGTFRHRLLYAAATSVICKHDKTGKWEPNYSNVLGNLASGAISNAYYPDSDSPAEQAITSGLTVTLTGTIGAAVQEFWPDIARKVFHKDPTNGLDAQMRAADEAKKKAAQDNQ